MVRRDYGAILFYAMTTDCPQNELSAGVIGLTVVGIGR